VVVRAVVAVQAGEEVVVGYAVTAASAVPGEPAAMRPTAVTVRLVAMAQLGSQETVAQRVTRGVRELQGLATSRLSPDQGGLERPWSLTAVPAARAAPAGPEVTVARARPLTPAG
jgi:hypothetical protein